MPQMRSTILAAVVAMTVASAVQAQTVKVGVVNTFTGPQASYGDMSDKGMRLYLKLHKDELPSGVGIEIINRDDGGPSPDRARQLAKDLVVRDKVQFLAGAAFTPVAMGMAPVATAAKVPFLITNAGTSVITRKSPYIVRFSFTIAQSVVPLGTWAAKEFKTAYTLVSDYAPGHDAASLFAKAFEDGGGKIIGSVQVPLSNQEFSPYLQRVRESGAQALMVFVPGGRTATALIKGFSDLGLRKDGISLIGPGDIVPDEELPNMRNAAQGVKTVLHYSSAADRPANKRFVAAWKKEYGAESNPNFVAVAGWDAMAAIMHVVKAQNGRIDSDKAMELLKHYKNPDSPRGPIAIDPETRDIMQNEYLREVREVDGKLANVEIKTVAEQIKDPWKVQHKE